MTELLTAAQMRAIERTAIESGEVTGLELMERAGRGVVDAILDWRPDFAKAPQHALVLCGPGNNGGDGFVVARLLKERGWDVEVFLYGEVEALPPDAAQNAKSWQALGRIQNIAEAADAVPNFLSPVTLIVDAIFGIGLSRPLEDGLKALLSRMGQMPHIHPMIALDIASGLCSDSGRWLDPEGRSHVDEIGTPHLTVTFHRPKRGHCLASGPCASGDLRVVPIGLNPDKHHPWANTGAWDDVVEDLGPMQHVFNARLERDPESHKFDHGHALVLSGGVGRGGAARLAARGALRVGAGVVTVGCPSAALIENAARLDAVMLRSVTGVEGLGEILSDRRINALCLGPGFGVGAACREMVAAVLNQAASRPRDELGTSPGLSVVLDADALTSFAENPELLFGMLGPDCVMTPHAGEFRRLFPDLSAKLEAPVSEGPAYSKLDAAREAAARAGCVVLFKGADTVIAHPEGRCAVNSAHYERAAPWLATAGSGDVLAGFIAGLLARGLWPMQAAETAAWLHVQCALNFGPGLIAEDLPEQLPAVFRELGP